MNIVGYLVTMANIQALGGPESHVKDLSVKVADLASLTNDLKHYPEFEMVSFKKNGITRVGDVGIYLSNKVWEYLYHGTGSPYEEGTIIIIIYENHNEHSREEERYVSDLSYMIARQGFTGDEVNPFLQKYFL